MRPDAITSGAGLLHFGCLDNVDNVCEICNGLVQCYLHFKSCLVPPGASVFEHSVADSLAMQFYTISDSICMAQNHRLVGVSREGQTHRHMDT